MIPLISFALSLLAVSSVSNAYPIGRSHASNALSNTIKPRAAEPRLLPATESDDSEISADPHNGELIYHLFNDLGLDKLNEINDLDNWKDSAEPKAEPEADPEPTETTHAPSEPDVAQPEVAEPAEEENSNVHAPDSTHHEIEHTVRDPTEDPLGFVSDFFGALSRRVKAAVNASDEHTLV